MILVARLAVQLPACQVKDKLLLGDGRQALTVTIGLLSTTPPERVGQGSTHPLKWFALVTANICMLISTNNCCTADRHCLLPTAAANRHCQPPTAYSLLCFHLLCVHNQYCGSFMICSSKSLVVFSLM